MLEHYLTSIRVKLGFNGNFGPGRGLLRALPHGLGIFRLRATAEKEHARLNAERGTLAHIPY